jgi:hypothetical protein
MWGGAAVSMKRFLSNGVSTWTGQGGTPTTVDIQRIGILRELRLLTDSTTAAFTAGAALARDVLGPWNLYQQLLLTPNQQAPIFRMSGYGAYLVDLWRKKELQSFSADTVAVVETSADPLSNIFSAGRTTTNGDWRLYHNVPLAQNIRSLGTEIGLWPLENPAVQLQLAYTPNSVSSVTPFIIDTQNNTTALAGSKPYYGDPTSNVTIATPTIDVRRMLWDVPQSENDDPPYTYVVTWLEERPQGGNVNGASFSEWKLTPLSGVLLRLGCFIFDGGASAPVGAGVLETSLTGSNALSVIFGADTQKYSETGAAAHARIQHEYGFAFPQGAFVWDLLGQDLTLADVIDSYTTPEVRLDVNLSTPLGAANSAIFVQREMLVPIELSPR